MFPVTLRSSVIDRAERAGPVLRMLIPKYIQSFVELSDNQVRNEVPAAQRLDTEQVSPVRRDSVAALLAVAGALAVLAARRAGGKVRPGRSA
jgi:hypothetical protein